MAPPGQSSNQPLPSKELALFKKIIKCYEHKQYKIGLRCAKTILSNPQFAEHGETLAMRGLILNCTGKHAEAQESVKKGLLADIRSYVCWHVYGLVQRADKKYDEAIKAYKQALKIDKDNLQILRDLSLLQIQMRDLEGYRDSRYRLLRLRPNQRVSWIAYATAYHLLKDYDQALNIVNEIIGNNTTETSSYDFEKSELILYQNMILRECGQLELALEKLEENSTFIVDKLSYMEIRADILTQLGHLDEAERIYRALIDRNPENVGYYTALEDCLGLGAGSSIYERLINYDSIACHYPKAAAPKRIPLYFVEGEELKRRLSLWIIERLRKGIPSLFKSLLPLYDYPEKVVIIESILINFVKKLEENGYKNGCLEDDAVHCESPTTVVWLYALVAQHFDRLRSISTALKYIDRALQHTPTLIELNMMKAKIYKHAGDYVTASRIIEDAQSLDTADRYLNSKCAKYMLRAGRIKEAEDMCAKFTREGVNASVSLNEMQCMWYETEVARALRRANNYGDALRKCHQIEQHFAGMVDDQFDFHSYCLRKTTLTAYIRLLRLEDGLRGHDFYYRAAKIAVKLRIVDRPSDVWPESGVDISTLTPNEMKKMKRKANKEKMAREAAAEEEKKKNPPKDKDGEKEVVIPDGPSLLKCESPLAEATKFIQPFILLGSKHVTAYALSFDVYYRRKKPLLMLKCLSEGLSLDVNSPLMHICKIKFLSYYSGVELTGVVGEVAKEMLPKLFPNGTDAKELNETFRQQNNLSLPHRMAVAESMIFLDPSSESSVKSSLIRSFDEKLTGRTLSILVKLKDGVHYGRYGNWSKEEVDQLNKLCGSLFREANAFGGGASLASAPDGAESVEEHHSFE